jgi:hypothetical protein
MRARNLEFFEAPNFEDLVACFKTSYASFRDNNPTITGKSLRLIFVNILNDLYNKFYPFENFRNIYPNFEDFKSRVSKHLRKKNGYHPLKEKNKRLILYEALKSKEIDLKEDNKIEDSGAWKIFFENQRMLKLTGREDDW